ncbi:hypothetical protein ACHAPT_010248 [Fusarium lateritium]
MASRYGPGIKRQPRAPAGPSKLAVAPRSAVPEPWNSALKHLRAPTQTLLKTDLLSCLCYYQRPQSWIFFVVGEGCSMPPIVNIELYRHVVFAIMLEHWIVVHVDLVDLKAALLDPKTSDGSKNHAQLRQILARWLGVHLGDNNMRQKLELFEKECEQHNDTGMLAIANISALAQGYSFAKDINPVRLRTVLISQMCTMDASSKPSHRFKQWTNIFGLRTADSMFELPNPSSMPPKSRVASFPDEMGSSNKPKSCLASPMTGSTKRKHEAASTAANMPAKRRQAVCSPMEEESSGGFWSALWKKWSDPDAARESTDYRVAAKGTGESRSRRLRRQERDG